MDFPPVIWLVLCLGGVLLFDSILGFQRTLIIIFHCNLWEIILGLKLYSPYMSFWKIGKRMLLKFHILRARSFQLICILNFALGNNPFVFSPCLFVCVWVYIYTLPVAAFYVFEMLWACYLIDGGIEGSSYVPGFGHLTVFWLQVLVKYELFMFNERLKTICMFVTKLRV